MGAARRSVGRQFIFITPGSRAEIRVAMDVRVIEYASPASNSDAMLLISETGLLNLNEAKAPSHFGSNAGEKRRGWSDIKILLVTI